MNSCRCGRQELSTFAIAVHYTPACQTILGTGGDRTTYTLCLPGNSRKKIRAPMVLHLSRTFSVKIVRLLHAEFCTKKVCEKLILTINFCTNFFCTNFAVDKLSNIWKYNFLIFFVDK